MHAESARRAIAVSSLLLIGLTAEGAAQPAFASGTTAPSMPLPVAPTLPPTPSGGVHWVPASVPGHCSVDVTGALNTWMASVPDNSTIEFPRGACYEVEGSLYLENRSNLLINGNGAEFLARTIGRGTAPPPHRAALVWPVARAQWWVQGGHNITLENLVIHGAANVDAPYEGTNWGSRPASERAQYIGQYGVRFAGTNGALLEGSTITDTFSDSVGVTAYNPGSGVAQPARNITIENNVMARADRDGPSVYDGENIVIAHNSISDVWGPVVDLEPVATRWVVDNVTVEDNTAGTHAHYFMTAAGASATNNRLTFQGNVDNGGNLSFWIGSKAANPPRHADIRIQNNRANVANTHTAGALITVRGINGITITGNQAPTRRTAVSLFDSSGVTVSGNRFAGATAVVTTGH